MSNKPIPDCSNSGSNEQTGGNVLHPNYGANDQVDRGQINVGMQGDQAGATAKMLADAEQKFDSTLSPLLSKSDHAAMQKIGHALLEGDLSTLEHSFKGSPDKVNAMISEMNKSLDTVHAGFHLIAADGHVYINLAQSPASIDIDMKKHTAVERPTSSDGETLIVSDSHVVGPGLASAFKAVSAFSVNMIEGSHWRAQYGSDVNPPFVPYVWNRPDASDGTPSPNGQIGGSGDAYGVRPQSPPFGTDITGAFPETEDNSNPNTNKQHRLPEAQKAPIPAKII